MVAWEPVQKKIGGTDGNGAHSRVRTDLWGYKPSGFAGRIWRRSWLSRKWKCGGAIKITAGAKLIIGGKILANGGMGMADSTNDAAKSGAGGSGGAVYLKASDL